MPQVSSSLENAIHVAQPILFNKIRSGELLFSPSDQYALCRAREEELRFTASKLESWRYTCTWFLTEPVQNVCHGRILALMADIESFEAKLRVNQTLVTVCEREVQTLSAQETKIGAEIVFLTELNERLKDPAFTLENRLFQPIPKIMHKQLYDMLSKIRKWQDIHCELHKGPLHKQMASDLKKIGSDIQQFQEDIKSIDSTNIIFQHDLEKIAYKAKEIETHLDRLTQLNEKFKEHQSMMNTLEVEKEKIMSCFNYVTLTLRNTRYSSKELVSTNADSECILDSVLEDEMFICTLSSKGIKPK